MRLPLPEPAAAGAVEALTAAGRGLSCPPLAPPSSRGLGHSVLSRRTGVRISLGVLKAAAAPERAPRCVLRGQPFCLPYSAAAGRLRPSCRRRRMDTEGFSRTAAPTLTQPGDSAGDALSGGGAAGQAEPSPDVPAIGRVGEYTLLSILGEGGMGTVFRARQERPRREVALKLVRAGF